MTTETHPVEMTTEIKAIMATAVEEINGDSTKNATER